MLKLKNKFKTGPNLIKPIYKEVGNMKNLILFIVMVIFYKAHAADDKKIYTQAEFDAKVEKLVDEKINRIKKSSIATLTKEILVRERKMDEKERSFTTREEQIKISESTLTRKILELEKKQGEIIGCIDNNKNGQARRIKQMVSVIGNMKPVKAAEVLSVQDSLISVKILAQIDPKKASKIFNLMDKEVSARLQKQYLNMQK